ncbi:MAG: 5'-deoxyadenosine deaminase [Ignavibacteria bacterium]|nr:5'-deoxyadenosine deaminase [Ignavibacteria bacterium]
MNQTLIKVRAIVTMDSDRRFLENGGILLSGNTIERVLTGNEMKELNGFQGEVIDVPKLVAIPGFVQTHIHLCQTIFRGLADDLELLDWLKLRIFPYEAAHNEQSMYISSRLGIAELIRAGTTTIMDMGSVNHEDQVVRAIDESGLRAFVGKAMMDENDIYPSLKESTKVSLSSALKQAEQWHNTCDGRVLYAVAPRFVLSCTETLLREAYEMTKGFPGMLFHSHAAENRHELEAVRRNCKMDNVEYFDRIGVLQSNTCLAHCIWLSDNEVNLLRQREAKVLHCPSANMKLGSGIARVPEFLSKGVTVSLGADGAPCNNRLDMFEEMRLAALIQKPLHGPRATNAQTMFEMATLGGAKTLGLEREIGSIEAGKKADLVLLDVARVWNPSVDSTADSVYSSIVYSCSPENVRSVLVNGKWLYKDGVHTTLDEEQVVCAAQKELRRLLDRVE